MNNKNELVDEIRIVASLMEEGVIQELLLQAADEIEYWQELGDK